MALKQRIVGNVGKHQILALKMLFAEEQVVLLHINRQCTCLDEDLTRTGIVQNSNEGKLHFVSCTAQAVNKYISHNYARI